MTSVHSVKGTVNAVNEENLWPPSPLKGELRHVHSEESVAKARGMNADVLDKQVFVQQGSAEKPPSPLKGELRNVQPLPL